ncbi:hypothetical protein GCM10023186_40760 [Hymenobacter koreensis]|uniref:Uncharacterized protein n=1 Tax=Hymenobacter koreensis TaxID=1084523 RepID=A0ABP8JIK4_9BACT
MLTREEARSQRNEEAKRLTVYRDTLAQRIAEKKLDAATAATLWADTLRQHEERLGRIGVLRQPPSAPQYASSIVFDPFGAGISGPRRMRANRQLRVEAVNINPFKYDVELDSKVFSYTYENPAAPKAGTAAENDKTKEFFSATSPNNSVKKLPSFAAIKRRLALYDLITQQLTKLYRQDTRPIAGAALNRAADTLFNNASLTAANFAAYRGSQADALTAVIEQQDGVVENLEESIKSLKPKRGENTTNKETREKKLAGEKVKLMNVTEELAVMNLLLTQTKGLMGGLDAAKAAAVIKEAETLGRFLIALRDESEPRFQTQFQTKGDEMDTKLKLTVRADYLIPPGRAAGKLLEWQTTTQVTHRFRVSASAGAFVTGLRDYSYGLLEDSSKVRRRTDATSTTDTTTAIGYKRDKRIARLNGNEKINIGFTGLTHFHYRLLPAFDVAASLGLGAQPAGLQLLAGLTVLTGGEKQRLCLTGGMVAGKVNRLSGGYHEGQRLSTGISIVPTQAVNEHSWFFALTYNLTGTRTE